MKEVDWYIISIHSFIANFEGAVFLYILRLCRLWEEKMALEGMENQKDSNRKWRCWRIDWLHCRKKNKK